MPENIKLSSINSFYTFILEWIKNEKEKHVSPVIEETKED